MPYVIFVNHALERRRILELLASFPESTHQLQSLKAAALKIHGFAIEPVMIGRISSYDDSRELKYKCNMAVRDHYSELFQQTT